MSNKVKYDTKRGCDVKYCNHCHRYHPLEEFRHNSGICKKMEYKRSYAKHKNKILEYNRKCIEELRATPEGREYLREMYRINNEKTRKYREAYYQKYYQKNKEKIKKQCLEYAKAHGYVYQNKWNEEHYEERKSYVRAYQKMRRKQLKEQQK